MTRPSLFVILVLLLSPLAEARVFDLNQESFAAYLRGQYQMGEEGNSSFAPSSGAGTSFDSTYHNNPSYEFGFIYSTHFINWRFGFEVIKPTDMNGIQGSSSSGTPWYSLNDSISGYVPKLGLEFNVKHWPASRIFLNVDGGYATVTVQNSYTFTAAGSSQFGGISNFTDAVQGTGIMVESSVGFETVLSDTATIVLDAGYRNLDINSFTYSSATQNFQGTQTNGGAAMNTDGSPRSLSLSGPFASVAIRVWIH